MEPKKPVRRSKRKGTIQLASSGSLSDREVEDVVGFLWEHMDELPVHVQTLLISSQHPGNEGMVSYVMAAGWALGKFDYVVANPWLGTKGGWVSKGGEVN